MSEEQSRLLFDSSSSRIVRIMFGLELFLALVSLLLAIFANKAPGILFILVVLALILAIGVGLFLYIRYRSIPVVKEKQFYLSEKSKIAAKLSKTKAELRKTEQALASNQSSENTEIEKNLQKIHKEYIENGLISAKIDQGNIPGIGPKLKEKLKANRVFSAADIGTHIQNLEGFGASKAQALLSWKQFVLANLEKSKPANLPDEQLAEIQSKYKRQHNNLIKARESHQLRQTEISLELDAVNRNLGRFSGISFINSLGVNLFGNIQNKAIKKNVPLFIGIIVGLGALVQSTFFVISASGLAVAYAPTATLPPSVTPPQTQKPTSTVTITPTVTLTSTITNTPTTRKTPTITNTPTVDLSFYELSTCLPRDTLVQRGKVVEVVDGDTVHVQMEDGFSYSVRYIGIDTPERDRPFYEEAAKANSDLVLNKDVILIADKSNSDSFDRLLRYVIVKNIFVNLALVKSGYAEAEDYPPDIACSETLASAQMVTRNSGLGIWLPTQTLAPAGSQVVITAVNKQAEFVDIQNMGDTTVDLAGWKLVSEKGNQSCNLAGVIIAGEILRIWAANSEGGGFNCGFGTTIWNNSESDPAVLYNAQGVEVSRR